MPWGGSAPSSTTRVWFESFHTSCSKLSSRKLHTCPRAGWISTLLLRWLRKVLRPPGPRTHPLPPAAQPPRAAARPAAVGAVRLRRPATRTRRSALRMRNSKPSHAGRARSFKNPPMCRCAPSAGHGGEGRWRRRGAGCLPPTAGRPGRSACRSHCRSRPVAAP